MMSLWSWFLFIRAWRFCLLHHFARQASLSLASSLSPTLVVLCARVSVPTLCHILFDPMSCKIALPHAAHTLQFHIHEAFVLSFSSFILSSSILRHMF